MITDQQIIRDIEAYLNEKRSARTILEEIKADHQYVNELQLAGQILTSYAQRKPVTEHTLYELYKVLNNQPTKQQSEFLKQCAKYQKPKRCRECTRRLKAQNSKHSGICGVCHGGFRK